MKVYHYLDNIYYYFIISMWKKENPIEILKPTEIEQTSGIYEIETIDFNIGERNIDDINYSLKGIISIPKEPKQKN